MSTTKPSSSLVDFRPRDGNIGSMRGKTQQQIDIPSGEGSGAGRILFPGCEPVLFFGVDQMSKASWIYQDVPLSKIIDHPVNSAIYGDNFDDALVESIKQTEGVIEPVHLVKHEGGSFVCLSGHRRRQATAIAGFQTIAAMVYRGEMTAAEQVIHVIEANRKREKTVEQKAREVEKLAIALKDVAAERKKRRPSDSVRENSPAQNSESGRAMDEAAKATGIGSRQTAERAVEVVHKVDELKAEGKTEEAAELVDTLNNKSVKAAHEKATGKPAKPAKATKSNAGPFADLVAGIEWALTQVVPRSQEIALRASQLLGKSAGLFDLDAVKAAVKTLHVEFTRIEREACVQMEAEKRRESDA